MVKDLAGIVSRELSTNIDYAERLRQNVTYGLRELPGAMVLYISLRYSVGLDEMRDMKELLFEHGCRCLGIDPPKGPRPRRVLVRRKHHPRKAISNKTP